MTRQRTTDPDGSRRRARRGTTPRRTAALVVVGLLVAALLTAPGLVDTARSQPYGPARSLLVETTEVLAAVSRTTGLDVPWRTLDALVHGRPPASPGAPAPAAPDDSQQPLAGEETERPPTPPATTRPSPTPDADARSPDASTPSPTPDTAARVPTSSAPLRVWIAGDSMWERPGPKLVSTLEATGVVDVVELEFRYSTGLTRPDVFDWPAHARSQLATLRPEVVLFLVGPNDSQPLVEDGVRHEPGTDGFHTAYTARVHTMMEALAAGSDHVLWVGLPIVRDAAFDRRMATLDRTYAAQAALVEGVQHVPTRALFSASDGTYAAYLPGPDGAQRAMRLRDGIHLSDDGAARLARHLFDLLDDRYALTE